MKKRVIALLLCALMLLSFAACGSEAEGSWKNFTSADVNGKTVDEDIFKDKKVTMVNIWGTFCSPCIREMPDLEKLNKDYADKGFQVVGIVCDVYDDAGIEIAKQIISQTGVTYLNIIPSETLEQAKLNSVYTVPETIFIDEDGNQIGTNYVGSRSYEDWALIVDSVLAQVK